MSALFAATYPERAAKLLLFGGFALSTMAGDFEAKAAERLKSWGTGEMLKTGMAEPDRESREASR